MACGLAGRMLKMCDLLAFIADYAYICIRQGGKRAARGIKALKQ